MNPIDELTLRDRLRYSGPRAPIPNEQLALFFCTYCLRCLSLFPHEFRLCQTPACIERAIADRNDRIFEIQLTIPNIQAQLIAERTDLQNKIAETQSRDPGSPILLQYESVLKSLNANIGFFAKNERVDQILALKEQIRELSRRLVRPTFSEAFRQEVWHRDKKVCYLCQVAIDYWDGESMHIDHVRPRSQGGSDEAYNLRIAHPICNLRKGDRALSEKRMKVILKELRRTQEEDTNRLF